LGFEVLMAVKMSVLVFWVVTPCEFHLSAFRRNISLHLAEDQYTLAFSQATEGEGKEKKNLLEFIDINPFTAVNIMHKNSLL
jgi:hypothetical protein